MAFFVETWKDGRGKENTYAGANQSVHVEVLFTGLQFSARCFSCGNDPW